MPFLSACSLGQNCSPVEMYFRLSLFKSRHTGNAVKSYLAKKKKKADNLRLASFEHRP